MTRMLDRLGALPNVDLLCDPDVVPFYERFGMKPVRSMALRRPMGQPGQHSHPPASC